jgi:hypothetical protein
MILKLLSESIVQQWPELSGYIESALPKQDRSSKTMTNILDMLLQNRMSCWLSYDPDDNNRPNVLLLFTSAYDPFTEEHNLLTYAYVSLFKLGPRKTIEMRKQAIEGIKKFMLANGYKNLVGFTNESDKGLLQMVDSFGAVCRTYWSVALGG